MPKTTTPLAKGWTTLEGILTTTAAVAIGVATVPGLHALSPHVGAICDSVLVGAYALQRGLVKAVAVRNTPAVAAVIDSADPLQAILKDVEAAGQAPVAPVAPAPAPTVTTPVVAS